MRQYHRILILTGAILTLLPYVFMLAFGGIRSIRAGQFLMDYLIPGEVFFLVIGGGILMSIGSLLAKSCRKTLIIPALSAIILLIGGLWIAKVTGVADGSAGEQSPWFIVTVSVLILYDLAGLASGVLGIISFARVKRNNNH